MSQDNDFSKALAETEKLYNDTPAQSLDTIPDGQYQFYVDSAQLVTVTDKNTGQKIPTVKMNFICITPGKENKSVMVWDRLNRPESVRFFKEKLRRMKLNHEAPLSELEFTIKEMVNRMVTANVRTTPGQKDGQLFTNLYVQSCDGKWENGKQLPL